MFVRLGVQVDGREKIDAVDTSLRKTVNTAREFGNTMRRVAGYLVVGGIVNALKNMVLGQITLADQLQHNSERLGISTDELQKYEYVAGLMQVPVQQTAIALRFFNRAVGEAALGTKSANKVFNQLGVSIKDANGKIKPTDELLFEVADKLKNTNSQAVRTAYAMRLLGRNGAAMLPVLQKGGEELRQAFKDVDELGGGFNKDFVKAAHTTDVQLKRLKMGYRSIFVAVATEVLPVFNKWVESSIRTAKHLIDLAKHTYAFRTALATLAGGTLFFALYRLFKLFGIGKIGLKDLLSFFIKYPIIALFTAAIVALYIAFDDLYTFLKGGDSVIGRFLDHLGGAGTALAVWAELKEAIINVWEALKPAGNALAGVGKSIISAFVDSIPSIVKWGGIVTTFVVNVIDRVVTGLRLLRRDLTNLFGSHEEKTKALAEQEQINKEADARQEAYNKVMRAFDSITNVPRQKIGPAVGGLGGAAATAGGDDEIRRVLNQRPTLHIEVNNTIHGASDPKQTATEVGRATKGAVKDAVVRNRDAFNAVTAGMPVTGQ